MLNIPHANGILPFVSNQDLTGKEGEVVTLLSPLDGSSDGTVALFENSGEDRPFGIVIEGGAIGDQSTIAVLGATSGTLPIKARLAISKVGAYILADGQEHPHDTGEYWVIGTTLETAVDGEIIPIAPRFPTRLT